MSMGLGGILTPIILLAVVLAVVTVINKLR